MTWKNLLLIALVVLLVLIGVPMLTPGMGMAATCTECPPAVATAASCAALAAILVAVAALIALVLAQRLTQRHDNLRLLLLVSLLERPPQPA